MTINWQEVITPFLTTVGGGGVILATAAFLIKKVLDNKLTRDIEAFKAELQKIAVEHQVRFSKLHAERAEVIAKLYESLVTVFSEGHIFVLTGGYPGQGQLGRYNEMAHKIQDFCSYADTHRIYLPESLCKLVDEFVEVLRRAIIPVGVYGQIESRDDQTLAGRRDAVTEAFTAFESKIPAARRALEKEFRAILGVE
jgi:hypothetical protein